MDAIHYILISTACLSAFYTIYLLLFKHETNFRQLRYYLLASAMLSIVIPLSRFEIMVDIPQKLQVIETLTNETAGNKLPESSMEETKPIATENRIDAAPAAPAIDWANILSKGYMAIALMLLARILWQIGAIMILYFNSKRTLHENYVIIENNTGTFSFFNWIFIKTEGDDPKEINQLILHEKIHASQYHSLDTLLIELLAAVMWLNPLVWMMRNSIKLVHEYLADEGVLQTGINKVGYQALLINQVTEGKLICVSSSFNCSIKKRMIMMNKSNFKQKTKLRILALIPVGLCLFAGIAFVNGQTKSNIEPRKQEVTNKPFTVFVDDGYNGAGADIGVNPSQKILDKDISRAIGYLLLSKSNNDLKILYDLKMDKQTAQKAKFDLYIKLRLNESDSSKRKFACAHQRNNTKNDARFVEIFTNELSQIPNLSVKHDLRKAKYLIRKDSKGKNIWSPLILLDAIYLTAENNTSFFSKKENQQLVCDKIINAINRFRNN